MATFTAHAAIGAGVMAAPARLLKAPQWAINVCTVYGAVMGSFPDTFDWLMTFVGAAPRWYWYVIMHHSPPPEFYYQPPFWLHLWLDQFFHDPARPGWNWWPEMWWLEILTWVVAGGLLYIAYRRGDGDKNPA